VRKAHRRGLDVLCIVHGKGQHSEGGKGVLRDAVLSALTETGAAPLVLAFVTAPDVLGGSGALLVELKH
jgi:DNA-nicking Smr family endonuclease